MNNETLRLVVKVRKVNEVAAKWLEEQQEILSTGHDGELQRAFTWDRSPQGWLYWAEIQVTLLTKERKRLKAKRKWLKGEKETMLRAIDHQARGELR
jgi:hypothetical protein